MKKWFVGLLMLLALVLMQSTAMAATKCPTCGVYRTVKYINEYEYLTAKMHKQIGVCPTCNTKLGGKFLNHTESLAATCTSPAYCNQCQHYYGLKNMDNHNWSEWQPNQYFPNQHYRYCLNSGCSASENEPHTSNADCVTEDTCSICNATYKDTTKHKGPLTYTYEKEDEDFHKKIESCDACGNRTGSFVSTKHVEESPATCTVAAWCKDCKQRYGKPNPNNHDWDKWVYEDENQHFRNCLNNHTHFQLADHRGNATCIVIMPCLDCGQLYNDPDNHQGPYTYAYAPSASSANMHTVTVTCTGCGKISRTYDEAHDTVRHAPQAPTCKAEGWNAYEACQNEGCGYTTYEEIPRLVHWYGEWTPNADGTHSATCRHGCGYRRTVPCACFTYQLNGDPVAEYTLCPVCGNVSDGTRLTLAENAAAAVLTGALPSGELVARMGTLQSGETIVSIAFEIGGVLTQPDGQVKITLPAEVLEGYTLSLLAEDGTETLLTDVQDGSFVLDFSGASSPVQVIRLVPQAE